MKALGGGGSAGGPLGLFRASRRQLRLQELLAGKWGEGREKLPSAAAQPFLFHGGIHLVKHWQPLWPFGPFSPAGCYPWADLSVAMGFPDSTLKSSCPGRQQNLAGKGPVEMTLGATALRGEGSDGP